MFASFWNQPLSPVFSPYFVKQALRDHHDDIARKEEKSTPNLTAYLNR